MTGGSRRAELTYLGGRTSMGKSTVAVCMGLNAAKAGCGVLIFSMEMTKTVWLVRAASRVAFSTTRQIPYQRVLNQQLTQSEQEAFTRAALTLSGLPMWIEERSGLSAMQIMATTRKVKSHFERRGVPLSLVIVDHVGKVGASSRYKGNRTYELGEISQELAHLAKTEDLAVLALAQLNRDVEDRVNKRPILADLRESGRLEEDADTVLLAYRAAYYLDREKYDEGSIEELARQDEPKKRRHEVEILVAKNGAIGTVPLWCDMASNVVCDLERWRERAVA
jgi:replicative DNA helicase